MGQKSTQTVRTQADPWQYQQQQDLYGRASEALSAGNPYEEQIRSGLTQYTNPGDFFAGNISTYMNPYQQEVIDASLADLDRSRQIANVDAASMATRAGAFGGDRAALLEAENNRNFMDAAARTSAQLRSAGFDQASRNLLAGGGMGLNALGQLQGLGQQGIQNQFGQYGLLANILRSIEGNRTNTQEQQGSPWSTVLGLGGIAAGLPFMGNLFDGGGGKKGG